MLYSDLKIITFVSFACLKRNHLSQNIIPETFLRLGYTESLGLIVIALVQKFPFFELDEY